MFVNILVLLLVQFCLAQMYTFHLRTYRLHHILILFHCPFLIPFDYVEVMLLLLLSKLLLLFELLFQLLLGRLLVLLLGLATVSVSSLACVTVVIVSIST